MSGSGEPVEMLLIQGTIIVTDINICSCWSNILFEEITYNNIVLAKNACLQFLHK